MKNGGTIFIRSVVFAAALNLSACSNVGVSNKPLVTSAALPSVIDRYGPIERTLECVRESGVLRGRTFVVGPFADSTGKINSVAVGATGNFVPQGGSASFITDAIAKAGGQVVSTYFGTPTVSVPAQYMVNGIFNSLDFGTPVSMDFRVAGLGPTMQSGWAQVTLTVQLDLVGSRVNRQISMIQRPVKYTQVGAGVGTDLRSILLTGNVAMQNQERLQFEAINGPIALGVIDVIFKEFRTAEDRCGGMIRDLLRTRNEWSGDERQQMMSRNRSVDVFN